MTLKQNSWHARFWKTAYCEPDHKLPQNLCPYFWDIVWALAWLPFTCWTYLGSWSWHNERIKVSVVGHMVFLWASLIGSAIAVDKFNQGGIWAFVWGWAILIVIMAALASIIMTVCLAVWCYKTLSPYFGRLPKESRPKREKVPNILVEYVKAKKNKYCPSITWEEEKRSEQKSEDFSS